MSADQFQFYFKNWIRELAVLSYVLNSKFGVINESAQLNILILQLSETLFDCAQERAPTTRTYRAKEELDQQTSRLQNFIDRVEKLDNSVFPDLISELQFMKDYWRAYATENIPLFQHWAKEHEKLGFVTAQERADLNGKIERAEIALGALKSELVIAKTELADTYKQLKDPLSRGSWKAAAKVFQDNAWFARGSKIFWALTFIGCLAATVWIGLSNPLEELFYCIDPNATNATALQFSYGEALIRALRLAPFIWLAWFAVKQFGYSAKVLEDYVFKSAITKAFESLVANEQLAKSKTRILDRAIASLLENPLRIYKIPTGASTPLQEIGSALRSAVEDAKKEKKD
ncbi:hypothetical protein ABIC63_005616 [Pseudacidovorax sp. 1753]|uniref:hypothetical protein n=1 Tax=Pseudacidovorax sp. 1753 TaxID=3156419 RepID=UPI003397A744